jgi:bacterioferritin
MQGNPAVIAALNSLLADEFAAMHQYAAHYGALSNWGFDALAALVKDRADDERKHADALIARILALRMIPAVSGLGKIEYTVAEVPAALTFDAAAETRAIDGYNSAIKIAAEAGDNATRAMLETILTEETEHLNEIEGWQDQIALIGLGCFLNAKV